MHEKPPSGAKNISRANQLRLVVLFFQVGIQITGTLPGLKMDEAKRSIKKRHQICSHCIFGWDAADPNISLSSSSSNESRGFIDIEEAELWLCRKLCLDSCV